MGNFNAGGAGGGAAAGALAGTAFAPGIGTAIGAIGGGLLGGLGGGKGEENRGIDIPESDLRTLNRINQEARDRAAQSALFDTFTPFGSRTFTGTVGQDLRENINLTPQDQALLDQRRQVLGLLSGFGLQQARQSGDIFSNPILGGQSLTDSAGELEQATFQRGFNLLQPNFQEDRERLESQLIARGIPRDSQAFQSEIRRLDQTQQQALENLALSSVGAGRQEQSRLLQADLARRGGSLNELAALASGPAGLPTFQATPNLGAVGGGTNSIGALLGQQNLQTANQQSQNQAQLGGLFDLASTAALLYGQGAFA